MPLDPILEIDSTRMNGMSSFISFSIAELNQLPRPFVASSEQYAALFEAFSYSAYPICFVVFMQTGIILGRQVSVLG